MISEKVTVSRGNNVILIISSVSYCLLPVIRQVPECFKNIRININYIIKNFLTHYKVSLNIKDGFKMRVSKIFEAELPGPNWGAYCPPECLRCHGITVKR